jgi:hypothetical protein
MSYGWRVGKNASRRNCNIESERVMETDRWRNGGKMGGIETHKCGGRGMGKERLLDSDMGKLRNRETVGQTDGQS